MEEKVEHHEFLARLQSPFQLYYAKIGQWHYIFDSEESIQYVKHFYRMHHNESPMDFTTICRNEFKYHGIARGKTEINAWRNACQNLLNLKTEES